MSGDRCPRCEILDELVRGQSGLFAEAARRLEQLGSDERPSIELVRGERER